MDCIVNITKKSAKEKNTKKEKKVFKNAKKNAYSLL